MEHGRSEAVHAHLSNLQYAPLEIGLVLLLVRVLCRPWQVLGA